MKSTSNSVVMNSPRNLLSQSLFFTPRGTSHFFRRWQLSFIPRIVQISHLTGSRLRVSGQRAARAGSVFPLVAALPCHSFPSLSPTNKFHFSKHSIHTRGQTLLGVTRCKRSQETAWKIPLEGTAILGMLWGRKGLFAKHWDEAGEPQIPEDPVWGWKYFLSQLPPCSVSPCTRENQTL